MKKLLLSLLMLSQVSVAFAERVKLPAEAELKQELLSLRIAYLRTAPEKIMIFFPSGKEIDRETLQQNVTMAVIVNSSYTCGIPETPIQRMTFDITVQLHSRDILEALYAKYKVQEQK